MEGEMREMTKLVYGLVGIAGLYQGLAWKTVQRRWLSQPVRHVAR
jgi:uncharacterized membrane protein YuzA (DUF378 family)